MSDAKDVKLSFKAVFNKQTDKFLFAEVDSDFVDVLLSFLTLPLGKIVKLMEKHYGDKAPVIGSLNTLYNGVANLDSDHFCNEGGKKMLLDPRSSFDDECRRLKININDDEPIKYFACENVNCDLKWNVGIYYDTARCYCGKTLKREIPVRDNSSNAVDGGVFIVNGGTFILSRDFHILPSGTSSIKQIVSNLGVTDIDGTELTNLSLGFDYIMAKLEVSLTDLKLKTQTGYEPGNFNQTEKNETSNCSVLLKVTIQKSTNKLIFAEADKNFVDFLFGFLTIPLGGVEYLLGNNTPFKYIDNLYKSVACQIDSKYLRTQEKTKLIKPTIPHSYPSKNRVFPLFEERARELFYRRGKSTNDEYLSSVRGKIKCDFMSPIGRENYVKGQTMYMVKDDLTVTPMCMTAYLSAFNDQKIPLSDADELVLRIGMEEALSILKASLSSSRALSNGLDLSLKKQPKEEH